MKKAGIAACSDGLRIEERERMVELCRVLESLGESPVMSSCIYQKESIFSGTGREKAEALMELYRKLPGSNIYDVSGGNMANEILDDLDYEQIRRSGSTFWGYSDLTTVINAIYTKTGCSSVLYQIRNLTGRCAESQQRRFQNQKELFEPLYHFIQGDEMQGVLVGGNIRCFLKLAGTEYFPDLTGKILVLEARGGDVPQMVTYLSQLKQLGAFRKVNGIFLGTFTAMERKAQTPDMESLVKYFAGPEVPIVKTSEIGHGEDAKALRIGACCSIHESFMCYEIEEASELK